MVTMAPESAVTIDTEGKASIVLDLDADGKTTAAVTEVIVVQLLYGSEPKAITNTIAYDVVLDNTTNNSLSRVLSNGNKTLTLTYTAASGVAPGATKLIIHLASGNDCQSTLVIPIIHNLKGDKGDGGSPGTSPYTLTPQFSAIPVQCEAGGVTSDAMTNFEVELSLRQGITKKAINSISSYSLTVDKGSYAYPTSTSSLSASVDKLKLTIPAGTTKASIAPFITVAVKSGSTVLATCSIAFPIGQKGLPGDTEATIHVLRYFNGLWESGKTYYYTDTTAPIVKLGNTYYSLNDTAAARSGISGNSHSPTNSTYWTEVSYRAAEWMEMFFANFARLGSAVFYERYLFSAYGSFRVNGSIVDNVLYDDPDVIDAITGTIGGSTDFSSCAWEPYFWVNLSTGKVYMENAVIRGLLTERFQTITDDNNVPQVIAIDASKAHHVSFQYHNAPKALLLPMRSALSGIVTDSTPSTPVTVPMSAFLDEGVSVRVANQFVREGILSTRQNNAKASVLLCADPRMFIPASFVYANSQYIYAPSGQNVVDYEGYFVWNGVRAKFILLPPGYQVRLTMLDTYDAINDKFYRYWYVEGGFDFASVAMTVRIYKTGSGYWERDYIGRSPGPQPEQGDEAFICPSWLINSSSRKIIIDLYGSQTETINASDFGA